MDGNNLNIINQTTFTRELMDINQILTTKTRDKEGIVRVFNIDGVEWRKNVSLLSMS